MKKWEIKILMGTIGFQTLYLDVDYFPEAEMYELLITPVRFEREDAKGNPYTVLVPASQIIQLHVREVLMEEFSEDGDDGAGGD